MNIETSLNDEMLKLKFRFELNVIAATPIS